MKKLIILCLMLCALPALLGTANSVAVSERQPSPYYFTGEVTALGNELCVLMDETQYSFGLYHIITSDTTQYFDKNGLPTNREAIQIGQRIEIAFSGQVMLSYPPKIAARSIRILS